MKYPKTITSQAVAIMAILMATSTAKSLHAKEWQAWVGAQSRDLGSQALAFLPNELWIHTNDSIRWTLNSTEIHTVAFMTPGQVRLSFFSAFLVQNGCGGNMPITPDGSSFDGSACVNSGVLGRFDTIIGPQTYAVKFPKADNFKLVCFVHPDMTGAIHVLDPSLPLPYEQDFYNRQAQSDAAALVSEASRLAIREVGEELEDNKGGPAAKVTAGVAQILTTTGGGSQTAALSRFLRDVVVIHVWQTVEWTNLDISIAHTVTFGDEPADPRLPSANVITQTPDGARVAVISSPADKVNSGLLPNAPQDRPKLAQSPLGVTRFRVTFTSPGTFNYICSIHDNLGMKGTVIVHP
jgi:plastocyanin